MPRVCAQCYGAVEVGAGVLVVARLWYVQAVKHRLRPPAGDPPAAGRAADAGAGGAAEPARPVDA